MFTGCCNTKYLRNYKELWKSRGPFSSSTKYYFLEKVRYLQLKLLDLELFNMKY